MTIVARAPGAKPSRSLRADAIGWGFIAVLLSSVAVGSGCVFTPPPALPEELARKEAEEQARIAALAAETPAETDGSATEQANAGPSDRVFADGDPPELGMSFADMQAYAAAQGDPEAGDFTLDEALVGIEGEGELWATLETTAGPIACLLFEAETPRTVANFVGLARGTRPSRDPASAEWKKVPFYDGTEFHRVIEGFMIQGGDPTGSGTGNAGYVLPDEFRPELRHDRAGLLSMANRGAGTGSSQFFVTLAPTPHLDDKHTIFGRCDAASIRVAEAIAAKRGPGDRPTEPQVISRVSVERRPASADAF
jgi:peptidyl-prolyl cis-trans isomerase A (cyclophilin A)